MNKLIQILRAIQKTRLALTTYMKKNPDANSL